MAEPELVLERKNTKNIVIQEPKKEAHQTTPKIEKTKVASHSELPIYAKNDTIKENVETDFLEEVTLDIDNSIDDTINLKNPNEVYYELYQTARENAKEYRMKAMESYLEAKRIKTKYMLFDIDDSDESDDENNI